MMIKRVLYAIVTACCLQTAALAEPPAGIVLYHKSGGEVYLLLAEHARGERGWAAFGGGARVGETISQTAAHKGEEESRGYYNQKDLLGLIEGQKPVMDGEFGFFFAEVDFVPAQRIGNNPIPEDEADAYGERSTFAWIPYSAVVPHLGAKLERDKKYEIDALYLPKGSRTKWLWRAWLSNMKKAADNNQLPW